MPLNGTIKLCKAFHHTAPKQVKNFLGDNTPQFISFQEWTVHSPDWNPLNYSVWDIWQEAMNRLRTSFKCYWRQMA